MCLVSATLNTFCRINVHDYDLYGPFYCLWDSCPTDLLRVELFFPHKFNTTLSPHLTIRRDRPCAGWNRRYCYYCVDFTIFEWDIPCYYIPRYKWIRSAIRGGIILDTTFFNHCCTRNGLAIKVSTTATIGIGLWILWISHYTFFEGCLCVHFFSFCRISIILVLLQTIDLALNVNVEFMLYHTEAMHSIFAMVPTWMMFPSYRTFLNLLVFIIGPGIAITFITAAKVVLYKEKLISGSQSSRTIKSEVRSSSRLMKKPSDQNSNRCTIS